MNTNKQVVLNPEEEPIVTKRRFVAYFDIMGFKNMIKTKDTTDVYNQFKNLLDEIKNELKTHKYLSYSAFSDLIVIITEDDSDKSFTQLADAALMMMRDTFFRYSWGMSGCIAKGVITYDEERNIFLGQPIVDAYLTSDELDYYGVVVHNSAYEDVTKYIARKNKNKRASHLENLFKDERLYFKSGFYSEFHLRWFDFDLKKIYDPQNVHKEILKRLKDMSNAIHGKARRYIENTQDIILYNNPDNM